MSADSRTPQKAWPGLNVGRRIGNRLMRARARQALREHREPEPQQHRHRAKWDCW